MIMKKYTILLLLKGLANIAIAQGIFTPSLYMYDPSWINPAFVGNSHHHVFSFYGSTWLDGYDGSSVTAAVSYEASLPGLNSGVALRVMNDKTWVLSHRQVSGLYSYEYKLPKSSIRLGVNAIYRTKDIDDTQIICYDCDPVKGSENSVYKTWSVDMGAAYQNENATVGIAVEDVFTIEMKRDTLLGNEITSRTFLGYVAHNIKLNKVISFCPSILYKRQQESTIDLNAYFTIDKVVSLGASYRKVADQYNEWLLHGNINLSNTIETVALYYPEQEQNLNSKRGELLIRIKMSEKKN